MEEKKATSKGQSHTGDMNGDMSDVVSAQLTVLIHMILPRRFLIHK